MPSEATHPQLERPLTIAIAALGGQGGGVLAEWIVAAGEHAGWWGQSTSVPGVAQRTGTTVYYVELYPATPGAPEPVFALMPLPGDVDVAIAAELMEAGRAILRGFVTPDRTTLVASSHRVYGITEKSVPGDGRADDTAVLAAARAQARRLVCFDMQGAADDTGSVISAVLFGALAASGALPFTRDDFEAAIRESGVAVASNLKGFAAGFERALAEVPPAGIAAPPADPTTEAGRRLDARIRAQLPAGLHGLLVEGVKRMLDYQDEAYANLYLDRVTEAWTWEQAARPQGGAPLLTATVARHLALWMAYEDTIRVADLKTRGQRFTRFRAEVRAAADQIVHVSEFMHPRYEEFCETLPAWLGRRLLDCATLRRLTAPLFAEGRRVTTSRLPGFVLLYFVGSLRRFRRGTLRYALEQRRIVDWLSRVRRAAGVDVGLAVEVAACQRLVKGYGDTHARGLGRFERLMALFDADPARAGLAAQLAELRDAALADEEGVAFGAALARHGLPA